MIVSFGMPLTGTVIIKRAERAADCISLLAEQNPAVLRLLKLVAGTSVYVELAFVVGDVVVAAGVERQAIPMDHPLAMNIQEEIQIAQKIYAEKAAQRAVVQAAQGQKTEEEKEHADAPQ